MLQGPEHLACVQPPRKLAVLFHGYGADGADLISLAEEWCDDLPDVDFLAPDAPHPCEASPFGCQWFSLTQWTPEVLRHGIQAVAPKVVTYLEAQLQKRGLTTQDLVLIGFSQGTMLALYIAYFMMPGCAGVLGYSGAFIPDDRHSPKGLPATLLIHGEQDQVVPMAASFQAAETIQSLGGAVQLVSCEGLGHGINKDGVALGREFLQKVFAHETI